MALPQVISVPSRGIDLHVRRWPRTGAPALVLVHGYPDTSDVWLPLLNRLGAGGTPAERGDFDVTIYDTRGIGRSAIPARRAYRLADYRADLVAVIDAVYPAQPVHLVGHDWGSIHSWESVCDRALRNTFATFTSISGPNLDHVGHWLRRKLALKDGRRGLRQISEQARKSWYIYAFHLPLIPALIWRTGGGRWRRFVRAQLGNAAAQYPPSTVVADSVRGLNTYRLNMLPRIVRPRRPATQVPIQLIVPTRDSFVSRHLVDGVETWANSCELHTVDANHWVQLTNPDEVARLIHRFAVTHDVHP